MPKQKKNETSYELPPGLAQPAIRALTAAGYTRLEQLAMAKEEDLQKLHGIGAKGMSTIRAALKARGLAFADPDSKREVKAPKERVFDNPTGWVRSHIKDYVESDGRKGHRWRGLPTLLLTTRGRKTGKLRRTALIYGQDGRNYLLVASNGRAPNHPLWYLNLTQNPEVGLQVGADKFAARARTATPKEKQRLWKVMSKIFPQYDKYEAKAGRDIPLVIVEPGA